MNKFKSAVSQMAIVAGLALSINATASADQQFLDDVIVDGSLCVGQDCVNGESFGFDTLRLKENNLRIHFQDTSVSASFPTTDWRIIANDSDNGGSNHFSIEDSTAGRTPFRIEGSAPTDSLVVEDSGEIGIGTRTPVVEMHIVDGDTPTLRLEQDGSSGFTPQTFDVAANETNFFIRDATNGSRLSFRIRPGAPESSIDIAANGDVGFGTTSPADNQHMRDTSGTFFGVRYQDASSGGANSTWRTLLDPVGDRFLITKSASGGSELIIESGGDVTVRGTLTTGGGTCGGGCDLVFTENYPLPSIEDHAEAMWENGFLPNIGPTIENEPINVSDKVGRMLNELETAHIYIAELNERLRRLEDETAE